MALTAGIVGLPNVGKSTLFNAITKAGAEAANYPFATIDPNVGMVEVPDERLTKLTELFTPKKTVPTTFEFTDIAGIVKGASKGEGLGNKFLANIREVDAIIHVVRAFDDENVMREQGREDDFVDPMADIDTINLELILADLESINKRYARVEKISRTQYDNDSVAVFYILLIFITLLTSIILLKPWALEVGKISIPLAFLTHLEMVDNLCFKYVLI